MSEAVRLNDIVRRIRVDALEMSFEEASSFLDLDAGRVEIVSRDLLREAEECGEDEDPDAGAFRNFKSALRRHRVESARFAFHAKALRQIALNWCEENQIVWE